MDKRWCPRTAQWLELAPAASVSPVKRWQPPPQAERTMQSAHDPAQERARFDVRSIPMGPASKRAVRMYHNARATRATAGWNAAQTSADAELDSSLTALRNRSRALVRDAAYAKRAKIIVVNNVIGAGVGMQAQVRNNRKRLLTKVNAGIEAAFQEWGEADHCHTGGKLHFADLERQAKGQIFEAGEVIFRKHYRRFGSSRVPFAIELIESERLADTLTRSPVSGADVRMGVEVDEFQRPVAYWLREGHPGDLRRTRAGSEKLVRVPADQIWHLYIVDRWPQSRGEPWLHATARRLNDMDGYSEAEIIAARNSATQMGFVETSIEAVSSVRSMVDETDETDGEQRINFEPGVIEYLAPGQQFKEHNPSRPNTAIDPFLRYMLREVAAGIGVSYESLSRDYSQSNYSSSRLALLDDRDLWRTLQLWWIRNFRLPLHREWLKAAVYGGAVEGLSVADYLNDPRRYECVKFKPRGWSWIDPAKEVDSQMASVRAGFTTVSDVIARTGEGRDLEDVIEERKRELEMMREAGLQFDTDPATAAPAKPAAPKDPAADPDEPADPDESGDGESEDDAPAAGRVIPMR